MKDDYGILSDGRLIESHVVEDALYPGKVGMTINSRWVIKGGELTDEETALWKGAKILERDDYEKLVLDAVKSVDDRRAGLSNEIASAIESARKQAQEAYDAAIGAGLPDLVAVGIARTYWPLFDPKSNRGATDAVRSDEVFGKGEAAPGVTAGSASSRARRR